MEAPEELAGSLIFLGFEILFVRKSEIGRGAQSISSISIRNGQSVSQSPPFSLQSTIVNSPLQVTSKIYQKGNFVCYFP